MGERLELRPLRARLARDLLREVEDQVADAPELVARDDGDAVVRAVDVHLAHAREVDADRLEVVGEAVVPGDAQLVDLRRQRERRERRRHLGVAEDADGLAVDVDAALAELAAALLAGSVLALRGRGTAPWASICCSDIAKRCTPEIGCAEAVGRSA